MSDVDYGPSWSALEAIDPEVAKLITGELDRQRGTLQLIASENLTSRAVLAAQGSVLTNKYAEGYPGRRYYGGCEVVDQVEELARERACRLFGADHANVQPHAGAQANMAAFFALGMEHGDTLMALSLPHGGHLTHGSKVNFSGKWFDIAPYEVEAETERIDMDRVAAIARERRPKVLVAGATAYPRELDFAAFKAVADEVGARLMVDAAHFAGLVAGGAHPSPVPHADVVTFTTHKTLRGPRGGTIVCTAEHASAVDKAVFPMMQGGPLEHVIAAKAVAFGEALQPDFSGYAHAVVENARALAAALAGEGLRIVSGGTDIHYLLADLRDLDEDLTGAEAEKRCGRAGISLNRNAIPFDPRPPLQASGLRIGTAAVTTQGMGTQEMVRIAACIASVLRDPSTIGAARAEVDELCAAHPAYAVT